MPLKDRVAIVTGASSGLGQVFALSLAAKGAKVVLADIKSAGETEKKITKLGSEFLFFQTDVGTKEDVNALARATVNKFGSIDFLINNAAIYDGLTRKHFTKIPPEEMDLVMNVNVKGVFLMIQAVYPQMKKQGYGKIINLASETFFSGSKGFVHYVASKGGVVGLTRSLAVELGADGIGINCIAPGFTDTEASRNLADVNQYDTSTTPLKRLGKPEDLVGPMLFFVSPESDFITGQTLLVNGGRLMR